MKATTQWSLGASHDDPKTTEYLLHVIGEGNEEYLFPNKLCADGERRNLFLCPRDYENVRSAISAVSQFSLKLEVFVGESDGLPARFLLWKDSVRKAAKVAQAKQRIHKRSALMPRVHRKKV